MAHDILRERLLGHLLVNLAVANYFTDGSLLRKVSNSRNQYSVVSESERAREYETHLHKPSLRSPQLKSPAGSHKANQFAGASCD